MSNFPRARFGAAVAVAFFCGLVFASGFDLTKFSWAQGRVSTSSAPQVPAPAVASLAETQNAFEAVVDHVKPAVVSIHVTKYATPASQNRRGRRGQGQAQGQGQLPPGFEEFLKQFGGDVQVPDQDDRQREGAGSGFIVTKDGYILTNNHVVAGMDRVQVTLADKRSFTAKVIGRDSTTDVAVIKIDDPREFPTVSLGDDATSRVGQWVLALGNPLDLDFTVTAGIISAKGRSNLPLPGRSVYSITDFIQTDAAINPGNSGGPLVNIRGEVIGINSAIASGTGYYAGYGFAIPIGLARQVMNDLIKFGTVKRAVVGVSLQEVTPEDAQAAGLKQIMGAKVVEFPEGYSAAKAAGVEIGDVIVAADGKPVDQVSTLQRIIRGHSIGETVKLDIQRFGQTKQIAVKLSEMSAAAPAQVAEGNSKGDSSPAERLPTKSFDKIGITVSAVPSDLVSEANLPASVRTGLLVTNVSARSEAQDKQIVPKYDIIEQELYPVRRDIKSTADLDQALSGLKSGDVLTLRIFTVSVGNKVVSLRIP
ncbi:MAG TPA: trypsin-like peptidase domain-containing protein [Gemmatimonadaceae bacterium]